MDPRYSGQDVVRCTACKNPLALLYCDICHVNLCKDCVESHLSDKTAVHKVVSLKQYLSTICPDHPSKQCELHCEPCDVPICALCVSSKKHKHHDVLDIMENYKNKKQVLESDLKNLESSVYPKYKEAASNIQLQIAGLSKNKEEMTKALKDQGEIWHKEIDAIVYNLQLEFATMDSDCLALLCSQEDEITKHVTEISQTIKELKSLFDSGDVHLVSKYKSKSEQYRNFPFMSKIVGPCFKPQEINREQLLELFGSLSALSFETEEQGNPPKPQVAESFPQGRLFLDVPNIETQINTGYDYLYGVSCLSDDHIWTYGSNNIIKLFNLKGELQNSVQSKSGKIPYDIAVKRCGDLVYADYDDSSVNIAKNTQIKKIIELEGWLWSCRPRGVCITSSNDLLVIMDSHDNKETKVVRYSGSKEKQTIQWDDHGKPLYSPGSSKFLCENKNSDICVADYGARAVVVTKKNGKLRFRYNSPATKGSFAPRGITTDSQSRILIADSSIHCIHILNKNGEFLRFIDNCSLLYPFGLSVDSSNSLFVAESRTGKVKKIKYCT